MGECGSLVDEVTGVVKVPTNVRQEEPRGGALVGNRESVGRLLQTGERNVADVAGGGPASEFVRAELVVIRGCRSCSGGGHGEVGELATHAENPVEPPRKFGRGTAFPVFELPDVAPVAWDELGQLC